MGERIGTLKFFKVYVNGMSKFQSDIYLSKYNKFKEDLFEFSELQTETRSIIASE